MKELYGFTKPIIDSELPDQDNRRGLDSTRSQLSQQSSSSAFTTSHTISPSRYNMDRESTRHTDYNRDRGSSSSSIYMNNQGMNNQTSQNKYSYSPQYQSTSQRKAIEKVRARELDHKRRYIPTPNSSSIVPNILIMKGEF